jgi:hypothetical protein
MNKEHRPMEEKVKEDSTSLPYVYPSETQKIYASGAFGGYTPHDFRVILYLEEPLRQDEILQSETLDIIRTVQGELILSPLAAKELTKWLTDKVKNFENDFGKIPGSEIK